MNSVELSTFRQLVDQRDRLLAACKRLLEGAESEGWDRYKGTDEPRTGIAEIRDAVYFVEKR